MMNISDFASRLELSENAVRLISEQWPFLTDGWDGALPEFLSEEFFCRHYPDVHGPDIADLLPRVRAVIAQCRAMPEAALYVRILYRGIYLANPRISSVQLPPPRCFGENGGIMQLMVALAGAPLIQAKFRSMGLPEHYGHDVLAWLGGTIAIYQAGHDNLPGHSHLQTFWMRYYLQGNLFRIGRLEYQMESAYPVNAPLVFRSEDGQLQVLVAPGAPLDARGLVLPADLAGQAAATAFIEEEGPMVTGIPVAADGHALIHERRTVDTRRYRPLCAPWSLVPCIHIPGGQRMPLAEVQDSMRQAKRFFKQYFHREVPMFFCQSWILNPGLQKYAPEGNMAQLQRWGHPAPPRSSVRNAGGFFVFGRDDVPPTELPARNHIQEIMQRIYREEGYFTSNASFVLADEL